MISQWIRRLPTKALRGGIRSASTGRSTIAPGNGASEPSTPTPGGGCCGSIRSPLPKDPKGIDLLIIGGGVIGSSTAYWASRCLPNASIVVLEPDPTYKEAATSLSVGGVRHQFSNKENVQISLFATEFLRNITSHLSVEGEEVGVGWREYGYLFLSGSNEGSDILRENHGVQTGCGADISLLDAGELKKQFPWLNTDDLKLGAFGKGEGFLDPYLLLHAFRRKAISQGVQYVKTAAKSLHLSECGQKVEKVLATNNTVYEPGQIVCAAGARTSHLVSGIGLDLPVRPKKRCVFAFGTQNPTEGLTTCPLVVDPSGAYFRPEASGCFIAGVCPPEDQDEDSYDFNVDQDIWQGLWETLAHRVPEFEELREGRSWAGHYDYNLLDQNAVIGAMGAISNLHLAAGFSGHGLQQSPAVGRALAELVEHGEFRSLDLRRMSPNRLWEGDLLIERNVV